MLSPRPIVVALGRRQRHFLSPSLTAMSHLQKLRLERLPPSPCTNAYATSVKNERLPRLVAISYLSRGYGELRHLHDPHVHRGRRAPSDRFQLSISSPALPRQTVCCRCYSQTTIASLSALEENPALVSPSAASTSADEPSQPKQYSYPELTADAARHKAGLQDPDVPPWQNPLHHSNPEMERTFPDDFNSQEEFEASILPAPAVATPDNPDAAPSHLLELAEEIVLLNMLEMSELVNKIADHYGFHEGMLSPDGTGAFGDGGEPESEDAAGAAAPAAEKASWDVKLVGFQDASKIKIIKEVRSLAGLGLKEAKELVEGAPKTILKQVKPEDANAIKAKLEELGATVELS